MTIRDALTLFWNEVTHPKLVLDVMETIGRTLTRAARIQEVVQDSQRQEALMEGFVQIVLEENPDVRERLVGKLNALRLRYGAMQRPLGKSPASPGRTAEKTELFVKIVRTRPASPHNVIGAQRHKAGVDHSKRVVLDTPRPLKRRMISDLAIDGVLNFVARES